MPIRPPQFDEAARRLEPILEGLPPKVIVIGGRAGVGKTSLARFLAWYFNSTLLELDLFIAGPGLIHYESEVQRIIEFKRGMRRPIFVEGLTALKVLEAIGTQGDYLIHIKNLRYPMGFGLKKESDEYEAHYAPQMRADHIVEVEHDA